MAKKIYKKWGFNASTLRAHYEAQSIGSISGARDTIVIVANRACARHTV
jgi:hypothetical protein